MAMVIPGHSMESALKDVEVSVLLWLKMIWVMWIPHAHAQVCDL